MQSSVAETHISRVFLTGDRAYKLLKAVDAGFVDFTDRETRLAATRAEYELNRRFSPDVYLGLADVHEDGELVDQMVVMRRMPEQRRLRGMLVALGSPGLDGRERASLEQEVEGCLRRVARSIASVHLSGGALRGPDAAMATRDSVARHWEENFTAIEPHVGDVIERDEFDAVRDLARGYLAGSAELFDRRIAAGWIRDGHGDLRAEDIFCLEDGPRILDCLAFAEEYRVGDVLADIGFLAMDVIHLASEGLAEQLMACYHEFSGELHPESLARHYIAYRAHVRVKIACLKAEQGDRSHVEEARQLHRLALRQLHRSRRRMVLVGGGPGTGKSTVSRAISEELGLALCVSDEIRKDLAGLDHRADASAAPGEGIYTSEVTDRTYEEMLSEAAALLGRGESVVLDASWSSRRHRDAAGEFAGECGAELVEIECRVPTETARERVASRTGDPSDATVEVVDAMAVSFEPWPTAAVLDTSVAADRATAVAVELVSGRPDGWTPERGS
jgi:aminoglycoside phosphotransferase family enzyme/predicted kinase